MLAQFLTDTVVALLMLLRQRPLRRMR